MKGKIEIEVEIEIEMENSLKDFGILTMDILMGLIKDTRTRVARHFINRNESIRQLSTLTLGQILHLKD